MNSHHSIKSALQNGQFTQAISQALDALSNNPETSEYIDLYYLLTVAYRLSKQIDQALICANKLIDKAPDHARAYQEMGHVYTATDNKDQAAVAFYQATKRNPTLSASWRALAQFHRQQGNIQGAEVAEVQLEYLSKLPPQILGAKDLMYEGDLVKAEQVCRQFLKSNKHHPEGMLLLAEIAIKLRIHGEAEFLLESCQTLYPEHKAAAMEYLKLLLKMAKFEKANVLVDKLLADSPDSNLLLSAKGSALVGLGDIPSALTTYHTILQQDENQPGIHLLLGHALKASGNIDGSISAYQQAYELKPDFGDAFWSLANTKTYKFTPREMNQMADQLELDSTSDEDKIHLHFALGKALEDDKNFPASFAHYQQGNNLKSKHTQYDPEQFDHQVSSQIEVCTREFFAQRQGLGDNSTAPVFIVGLPRAGSTLLEQILASHSQVEGTMELHNVLELASRLQGQSGRYPAILNDLDTDYFQRFGQKYLTDTQSYRTDAPYFIDKMPNNFLHIGLIKLILPNAKVIDARRDPMACCFSGYKQLFAEGQEFTYDLQHIGRYYRGYEKLMAHWDEVLPGFVLKVQHEEVIDDLETQVRRLLDFCGLPFEQACVDFHQTKRTIKTPSSEQVRQPIYRSGMEQWKNYQAFLEPLKKVLD